ncbi:hypothetical protein L3X38_004167 [Prunus dulcis]|uniref:Ubiquitin-like protease family profile domain-containing protein n=1 Tax=Prunus dulcis TaxID=3755 RepID=A0AAD4ZNH5_PRUDU|nr:hypothetical protein L3X38_004167 [Prunus dulcis]
MCDVAANTEPTCTIPTSTVLPTVEPVSIALLTTEPVGATLPTVELISVTLPAVEPVSIAPLSSTSLVPNLNSPQADDSEVGSEPLINSNNNCESTENSVYQLPPKTNHGKPPNRYSLEPAKKVRYPIANYMSTQLASMVEIGAIVIAAEGEEVFLVPYNLGVHWVLAIVRPDKEMEYYTDPLPNHMVDEDLKNILNIAIKIYNAHIGTP